MEIRLMCQEKQDVMYLDKSPSIGAVMRWLIINGIPQGHL